MVNKASPHALIQLINQWFCEERNHITVQMHILCVSFFTYISQQQPAHWLLVRVR